MVDKKKGGAAEVLKKKEVEKWKVSRFIFLKLEVIVGKPMLILYAFLRLLHRTKLN